LSAFLGGFIDYQIEVAAENLAAARLARETGLPVQADAAPPENVTEQDTAEARSQILKLLQDGGTLEPDIAFWQLCAVNSQINESRPTGAG